MSLHLRRLTAWLAASALVLKAAVPLLAAAAAQLQGVAVAQVCSLYGVATSQSRHGSLHRGHAHHHVAPEQGEDGPSHPAADHGRDHCALAAVVAMAVGRTAPPSPVPTDRLVSLPPRSLESGVPDDCALWVARLAHGPPVIA